MARSVWEDRSKIRCRGTWTSVRNVCKKKTGSTNPADWKQSCPTFVHQEDWNGILESWMTEKWKRRSTVGAENRKRVPGDEEGTCSYVRHTGGSINFGIHRQRLDSTRINTETRTKRTLNMSKGVGGSRLYKRTGRFKHTKTQITLKAAGTHYYICTVGTHCRIGQKLTINVSAASATPAPAPATPAPVSPPTTTPMPTPTPAPSTTTPPLTSSPAPSPREASPPSPSGSTTPSPTGSTTPPPPPPSSVAPSFTAVVPFTFVAIALAFFY